MGSGNDLVSGQYNGFETTTTLGAQLPDPPAPFNGDFILVVTPLENDPPFTPTQTLNGILGLGWNGPLPEPGGTGVVGFGGPNQGTGILGHGGGSSLAAHGSPGFGGIGVRGQGGNGSPFFRTVDPGTGVVGNGGVQSDLDSSGRPHGSGVAGVAGNAPSVDFTSGSIGVIGIGGNADRKTTTINNVPATVGPKDPGIGVLGTGAIQSDDGVVNGFGGAGVVGVAGGSAQPTSSDWADAGVFGSSAAGRGGVFKSAAIAQLRLVPVVNPTPNLPAIGQFGDLYVNVTTDPTPTGIATAVNMYLCVSPGDGTSGNTARWAPFVLGNAVSGG